MDTFRVEKNLRILGLIEKIFARPYFQDYGVLCGGSALYHAFGHRYITDIDITDTRTDDYWAQLNEMLDTLRPVGEKMGYKVKVNISRKPKVKMYYVNSRGNSERITVDIGLDKSQRCIFEPCFLEDIRSTRIEEIIASKLAFLSVPRLRGIKAYTDFIDVYASIDYPLDDRLLQLAFRKKFSVFCKIYKADKLRCMLEKYENFSSRGQNFGGAEIDIQSASQKIIERYDFLFA